MSYSQFICFILSLNGNNCDTALQKACESECLFNKSLCPGLRMNWFVPLVILARRSTMTAGVAKYILLMLFSYNKKLVHLFENVLYSDFDAGFRLK